MKLKKFVGFLLIFLLLFIGFRVSYWLRDFEFKFHIVYLIIFSLVGGVIISFINKKFK